jgi:hypothetical protein
VEATAFRAHKRSVEIRVGIRRRPKNRATMTVVGNFHLGLDPPDLEDREVARGAHRVLKRAGAH